MTQNSAHPNRCRGEIIVGIIIIILACIILLKKCLSSRADNKLNSDLSFLENPIVGLNFNPNSTEVNPAGGWSYDISTGEIRNIENAPLLLEDWNFEQGIILGISNGIVVETNMENGTAYELGPAQYNGSKLVSSTLKYRPQSQDYSALTENGILVLWEQDTRSFRKLIQLNWQWASFAYSWLDDGHTLCIPDDRGIAILNIDTLEEEHWLTIPITYSDGGALPPSYQKSFEVSGDQSVVVYCENEVMYVANVNSEGVIVETTILADHIGKCGFAISSDGQSIMYGVVRTKNTLFNPNYYEVWLYHSGEMLKIFESESVPNQGIEIYW